jgi:hypothetical protein
MDILRQKVDSLNSQREVLAALDGAYIQNKALGQLVTFTDGGLALLSDNT